MKYDPQVYDNAITKIDEAVSKLLEAQGVLSVMQTGGLFSSGDSVYMEQLNQEIGILTKVVGKNLSIFNKTKELIEFDKTNLVELEDSTVNEMS